MINWWLVVPMLAFFIAAVIGNVGWYVDSKDLKKTRIAYWKHRDANILLEEKYATLKEESNKVAAKYIVATAELHKADETIKKQIDEITHLHAQNTKLREDLQEEKAKVKALQMQTVEIETYQEREMKNEPDHTIHYTPPMDKPEPKRTPRKKAGQA